MLHHRSKMKHKTARRCRNYEAGFSLLCNFRVSLRLMAFSMILELFFAVFCLFSAFASRPQHTAPKTNEKGETCTQKNSTKQFSAQMNSFCAVEDPSSDWIKFHSDSGKTFSTIQHFEPEISFHNTSLCLPNDSHEILRFFFSSTIHAVEFCACAPIYSVIDFFFIRIFVSLRRWKKFL
jgi:hypothetical protein